MPQTIVFDTNYLRTFSQNDFLAGQVPDKLRAQITRALERSDLIALVETVRMETNAWLESAHQKKQQELNAAIQRLLAEGYTVEPSNVPDKPAPDIFALLQTVSNKCILLSPNIDDYQEAERRTSYRLAPHPKKNEDEEMRDRLIWCRMLRWSVESGNPVLIVSNDTLFKNGAKSEEGIRARIAVVEGEVDLDQRLGARPDHIVALVRSLLFFAPALKDMGIDLSEETIVGIEELRKVQESDGSTTERFWLVSPSLGASDRYATTLNSMGDQPLSLSIATTPPRSVARRLTEEEKARLNTRSAVDLRDQALNDLRQIIGTR